MKNIVINAKKREALGKKATKLLRRQDNVPCVLYGGEENIHFYVNKKELRKIIYTPEVFLVNLNIDGKVYNAIMKDLQFHPVSDEFIHIDFVYVAEDKKIIVDIPVKIEGFSIGIKEGGFLHQSKRYIKVKSFIKFIPDNIVIDITKLAIGKSIKISDINIENVELLDNDSTMIVAIKLTRISVASGEEEEDEEKDEDATDEKGEESKDTEEKTDKDAKAEDSKEKTDKK